MTGRELSAGWRRSYLPIIAQSAVGSTDITNQAVSITDPGRIKHLNLLFIASGLASGATLVITIEGRIKDQEEYTEVLTFTITEANDDDSHLLEIYEAALYDAIRFSVNKTGNSCLTVLDLSERVGYMPMQPVSASAAASSSPDEPLFPQLPT
jgi:hypothetical protein